MGVERVEQGAQDTALWGSYVQGDGVGGELADFHHLWSGGEEILNPVTKLYNTSQQKMIKNMWLPWQLNESKKDNHVVSCVASS